MKFSTVLGHCGGGIERGRKESGQASSSRGQGAPPPTDSRPMAALVSAHADEAAGQAGNGRSTGGQQAVNGWSTGGVDRRAPTSSGNSLTQMSPRLVWMMAPRGCSTAWPKTGEGTRKGGSSLCCSSVWTLHHRGSNREARAAAMQHMGRLRRHGGGGPAGAHVQRGPRRCRRPPAPPLQPRPPAAR